ncbi:MAG: type II toxin-antitoxin system RelE/ParE family toxin [Dethiobacteria bacterium]|jgi:toxin ParE1/3/4
MSNRKYILQILPLFEEDLNEIVDYITFKLKNPTAANGLVNAVEEAIYKRLTNPESFEPFQSIKEREYPYYRIRIKNFTIFYVVIDDIMEVRRILYNRRDLTKLL